MLLGDNLNFVSRAHRAGAPVQLEVYDGMWHDFIQCVIVVVVDLVSQLAQDASGAQQRRRQRRIVVYSQDPSSRSTSGRQEVVLQRPLVAVARL